MENNHQQRQNIMLSLADWAQVDRQVELMRHMKSCVVSKDRSITAGAPKPVTNRTVYRKTVSGKAQLFPKAYWSSIKESTSPKYKPEIS